MKLVPTLSSDSAAQPGMYSSHQPTLEKSKFNASPFAADAAAKGVRTDSVLRRSMEPTRKEYLKVGAL